MNKIGKILCVVLLSSLFFSCASIKNTAMNAASDSLAGTDKNGKSPKTAVANAMMPVLTGEEDPVLMAGFFPTALKLYEIVFAQNPTHQGMAVRTGALYVMYANAFIQTNADMLPVDQLDLQIAENKRAKLHYLRGRGYVLHAFDLRYPNFSVSVLSGDKAKIKAATEQLNFSDVEAAYWAGTGWLGAFSVDPLDTLQLKTLDGAVSLLERAAQLNPDYSGGAVWDVLAAFYAAVPEDFGGGKDKAIFASKESFRVSKGRSPGPYITYALSFCVPEQDPQGFADNLQKALAINPNEDPENRLATIIAQKKAAWLLEHIDDYFILWD